MTEPITTPVLAKNGINLAGNYKPQIQREWLLGQAGTQPLPTDQKKELPQFLWKPDGHRRWPDGRGDQHAA